MTYPVLGFHKIQRSLKEKGIQQSASSCRFNVTRMRIAPFSAYRIMGWGKSRTGTEIFRVKAGQGTGHAVLQ